MQKVAAVSVKAYNLNDVLDFRIPASLIEVLESHADSGDVVDRQNSIPHVHEACLLGGSVWLHEVYHWGCAKGLVGVAIETVQGETEPTRVVGCLKRHHLHACSHNHMSYARFNKIGRLT